MRCGVLVYTTVLYYVPLLLQYYYDDVRPAHEAAHGLPRADTRAGPCPICAKRAEDR